MTTKPVTITISDLSKAVREAVTQRAMQPEVGIHIGPILMGIIFRQPFPNTEEAAEIATNIVQRVGAKRPEALAQEKLEPFVLSRPGGPIVCGFIPENVSITE
jgi:hypothetical protein